MFACDDITTWAASPAGRSTGTSTILRRGRSGSTPCLRLLLAKGVLTLDELRRGIEELGPGAYDELSYFERWIASISNLLVEKGVLDVQELGAGDRRGAAAARRGGAAMSPRFPDGSARSGSGPCSRPAIAGRPFYTRGRCGTVLQVADQRAEPRGSSPTAVTDCRVLPVYRVRFAQAELWPDYAGAGGRRGRGRPVRALARARGGRAGREQP